VSNKKNIRVISENTLTGLSDEYGLSKNMLLDVIKDAVSEQLKNSGSKLRYNDFKKRKPSSQITVEELIEENERLFEKYKYKYPKTAKNTLFNSIRLRMEKIIKDHCS